MYSVLMQKIAHFSYIFSSLKLGIILYFYVLHSIKLTVYVQPISSNIFINFIQQKYGGTVLSFI